MPLPSGAATVLPHRIDRGGRESPGNPETSMVFLWPEERLVLIASVARDRQYAWSDNIQSTYTIRHTPECRLI
jgi:hypothetical protein